jgi:hypothetical protein
VLASPAGDGPGRSLSLRVTFGLKLYRLTESKGLESGATRAEYVKIDSRNKTVQKLVRLVMCLHAIDGGGRVAID